jgi:hypothetical protein
VSLEVGLGSVKVRHGISESQDEVRAMNVHGDLRSRDGAGGLLDRRAPTDG